jgi:hypothetical protein
MTDSTRTLINYILKNQIIIKNNRGILKTFIINNKDEIIDWNCLYFNQEGEIELRIYLKSGLINLFVV